jgi:hypothetical protein
MTTSWVYKDVVVQGINLGGDPTWGYLGAMGTCLIFFVNREYSQHAARICYETADGKRIGFQMYSMFGGENILLTYLVYSPFAF